jgi:hypothetical protein
MRIIHSVLLRHSWCGRTRTDRVFDIDADHRADRSRNPARPGMNTSIPTSLPGSFFFTFSKSVLRNLPLEERKGDLEKTGRLLQVPCGLCQNHPEMIPFDFSEGFDLHLRSLPASASAYSKCRAENRGKENIFQPIEFQSDFNLSKKEPTGILGFGMKKFFSGEKIFSAVRSISGLISWRHDSIFPDLASKRREGDAQHLGGTGSIPAGVREGVFDVLLFHLRQGVRGNAS